MCISPDGRFVFSGSADKSVKQWAADSGEVGPPPFRSVGGVGGGQLRVFGFVVFLFYLFFLVRHYVFSLVLVCSGVWLLLRVGARVCACVRVCV